MRAVRRNRGRSARLAVVSATLLLGACAQSQQYETASCALIDVSGTYAQQKASVVRIVKAGLLPKMVPGDSLFAIAIDSNSYEQDNVVAQITLDYVPSKANDQKLAFAGVLDTFASRGGGSRHTDISGAMMLCADLLRSTGAGRRAMFLFSDLQEDLKKGLKRDFKRDEFKDIHIAALNVIKLQKDSADPEQYRTRLRRWEERLLARGALGWQVIVDPVKIPDYIESLR